MTRRLERVCVIGAGLAGLACALASARAGLSVSVLDEAEHRTELQAHVEVVPNMLRDLVTLGVADQCVRAGFPFHGVDVLDRHGRVLHQLCTEGLAGPRYPAALGILRADLHQVFERAAAAAGATVAFGARVVSVEMQDEQVSVLMASGERALADLVILASGAASALRTDYFPQARAPQDLGQAWCYALIPRPIDLDRPLIAAGGPGQRVVIVPVRNDTASLALVLPARPGEAGLTATQLRSALQSFAPRIQALARQIAVDAPVAVRRVRSGVLDAPWHHGAVLAVGDCAHMLPPHFGQAAAQAVEDACVLGDLLTETRDRAALFAAFQQRRVMRARHVHELTVTAARWDLEPAGGANLTQLMDELSHSVMQPA